MADAYEPYHVLQQQQQQQNRVRDHHHHHHHHNKLDTTHFHHFHPPPPPSSFPLADSDFLTAGGFHSNHHNHQNHHNNNHNNTNPSYSNFMGFLGGVQTSSTSSTSITVAGVPTGGDHHQNSFHNAGLSSGDVLVFKPEPLSLSLSSHPRLTNYDLIIPSGSGFCRSTGGGDSTAGLVTVASRSCSGPLGPFTGYASILKGSRFLKPAQMLLDEFCNVGRGIYTDVDNENDGDDSSLLFDPTVENLCGGVGEIGKKKSKLISMLDEVYKRYKQYFEQLQAVMGSFECVAGLGHAAPFASLALKALSKHFKCLKNAITDQLQFSNNSNKLQQQQCGGGGGGGTNHVMSSENNNKNESLRFGGSHDGSRGLCSGGSRHGFADNHAPVWRPHRGLPERAVTVLRAWLFDHFLHPYPTDTDKLMLAKQTGLSRNQVSNWFINARVRVWKPMVEEIHMLETRQSQRSSSSSWRDERSNNTTTNTIFSENNNNPSSSSVQQQQQQRANNNTSPTRRARNEDVNNGFLNVGNGGGSGAVSFSYGIGSSNVPNGVSLTLGLHHQIGLPEANFQMTTAQRFGLDGGGGGGGGGGGYEGQNRQFGRDFIGGSNHQFLHDFVG